ncbi:MAG: SDR family NAD(P)-dependent oxidoreductase [Thermomicrobiales bacterium]
MMDIQGKVVLITGASSGIGLATAQLLAERGAKVALAARSRDKLAAIAAELPDAFAIPTDMADEDSIANMIQQTQRRFGRIDLLINNAGQAYDAPIEQIDPGQYRALFAVNVVGPLVAMQAVIQIMRQQGGGMIVGISSGTSLMYLPGMAAYASTKRALNASSLTARAELEKENIIVSVIYPYITLTSFDNSMVATARSDEQRAPTPGGWQPPPPDTAEYVAGKILDVIASEEAEQYAHDWMRNAGSH